jgi:hypothetical protein
MENITNLEIKKATAIMILFSVVGFMPTMDMVLESDAESVLNHSNDFNEHRDHEMYLYSLLHITNLICVRNDLTPFKLEDAINRTYAQIELEFN